MRTKGMRMIKHALRRIPLEIITKHNYLDKESIIVGYRGSITHGTYRPNNNENSIDDIDVMAIIIPSINHYFGLDTWGSKGTKEIKENEWDIVTYEFNKFMSLLIKGNPNVIGLLWLEENMYCKKTEIGDMLIKNRTLFSSKNIYHSFCGYAYSQLKKMTHLAFEGYMGEKRKRLVKKHGYDTKNASHLIRLLRMGIEFLKEDKFYVFRKDYENLLDIKDGKYTLEEIQQEAETLFGELKNSCDNSSLPKEPNIKEIRTLHKDILELKFYKN